MAPAPAERKFDPKAHIAAIDAAIQELRGLEGRTKHPAPMPHQYLGTIVDNTIGLLTAPANSLDAGARVVQFSESRNWLSLMQAVHRSFFASAQAATERGLADLCEKRGVTVRSRLQEATEGPLEHIETDAGHLPSVHRALKDLRAVVRTNRPGFEDYLEGALSTVTLTAETKRTWRRFFKAFSVVRNKASHSDPTLTDSERSRLRDGGFATLVSEGGELVMNPRMYVQVAGFLLDFLDLICDSKNARAPGAI